MSYSIDDLTVIIQTARLEIEKQNHIISEAQALLDLLKPTAQEEVIEAKNQELQADLSKE